MNPIEQFAEECERENALQGKDTVARKLAEDFLARPSLRHYSYHFTWMGRPIIQYPPDIIAMQELLYSTRPDLIIETGIAHGGSLIFYASLLELNALCGGPTNAHVLGVDIDIRSHNRTELERHPLFQRGRITMLEGSSIATDMVRHVAEFARERQTVMVCLDSLHTHDHVMAELEAYAPLVTPGSWLVVFDTVIESMPENSYPERPWGRGNNPKTALDAFLAEHGEFERVSSIDDKLLITACPGGFCRRRAASGA